jgi:Ni/Fe-hydrogenase subunit HybB-like protein
MSAHDAQLKPVGGPVLTKPFMALGALALIAILLVLWRFVVGLGPATALSDGYPWGAWKVFNVIVLTALASGGYATAMLVYALNKGKYHPLARTAILTSAMGYTTGVMALGVDIGRPWNFWRLALVWNWNLHSVLLEVAICISVYLIFLWLEVAPPVLDDWKRSPHDRLKRFAAWVTPKLHSAYPFIIAAAITLPSMHQSSLGSLFLLAGPRVHPLWQTPLLPGLFLLSCWFLGYACVVIVALLSSLAWKRPLDINVLASLSKIMAYVMLAFLGVRFIDVAVRGRLALAFSFDFYSLMFLLEAAIMLVASLLILSMRRPSAGALLRLAMLVAIGGGLYRLDASLIAFMPGSNWSYFPSIIEMIITLGFIAMAVMGYLFAVKRYPILPAPLSSKPAL